MPKRKRAQNSAMDDAKLQSDPSNDANGGHVLNSQDATLAAFRVWCNEHNIDIHDSIIARRIVGRGVGIETRVAIKNGTVLINVPISALLRPQSIPETFFVGAHRHGLTRHALLSAYLTFGDTSHLAAWRATWPCAKDFANNMPLVWPQKLKELEYCNFSGSPKYREDLSCWVGCRQIDICDRHHAVILPPTLTGQWAGHVARRACEDWLDKVETAKEKHVDPPERSGNLWQQQRNYERDLRAVKDLITSGAITLHKTTVDFQDSFSLAWLNVNTRTFYYVDKEEAIPDDSNEAMIMCPFIDLFNHADQGCGVQSDENGFKVIADRDYEAGEELHLTYGSHSNDFLLTEYGFILDKNDDDRIPLDQLILGSLKMQQEKMLEDAGYLGEYSLYADGTVCFRTEAVARYVVCGKAAFKKTIAGKWQDDEMDDTGLFAKTPKMYTEKQICTWIRMLKSECENSLLSLRDFDDQKLLDIFTENDQDDLEVAEARRSLVMRRWEQIWHICVKALQRYAIVTPWVLMPGVADGKDLELDRTLDDVIAVRREDKKQHTERGHCYHSRITHPSIA